jgi:proline iminopeptidase
VARPLDLLLGEPVHFLMQTRQFHNLRKRINAEP